MKKIKKEIKILYTFIIIFIICAFLLLFNIVLIISKPNQKQEKLDFDRTNKSVVSIQTYIGNSIEKKGSGFIYKVTKDKAYILTNNHVVEGANDIKIFISEEEKIDSILLGYDKYLDAAVLVIENNGYKALKINTTNNINIGDIVYTIGTPLDNEFFNSASSGIISKKSRLRIEENLKENILMDMIQTDIITNPGNSGSPLFNDKLEVIGICTSNIDKDDNHSGISFAVPITQVINKIKELEEGPVAKRKIPNADIVDVKDSEILYKNNLIDITKENYGVAVVSSDENSPLKKGDVILEINNNKVKDIYYYDHYLNLYLKNDKIKLKIKRDEKEKIINVIIK